MSELPRVRRKALWMVLGVLATIALAIGGIYLDAWTRAGRVIQQNQAVIEEKLEKLRQKQVNRAVLFQPEEEGNSWEPFVRGLMFIASIPSEEFEAFPSYQVEVKEVRIDPEGAERLLKKVSSPLDDLRTALRRKWTEPSYDYDQHVTLNLPHVSAAIRCSRMLMDAAKFRHDGGRSAEAVEFLTLVWGVADRVAVKGPLTCPLVSLICKHLALNGIRSMLENCSLSESQLATLQRLIDVGADVTLPDLISGHELDDLLARIAVRQAAEAPSTARDIGESEKDFHPGWPEGFSTRILIARYFSEQDKIMAEMARLVHAEPVIRKKEFQKLEVKTRSSGSVLNRLTFRNLGRFLQNLDEHTLRLSLARLALALARFQRDRGTFPASLSELVPAYLETIPRDEINQASIQYSVKDEAVHVYSRGGDGDDDGGRPVAEGDGWDELDDGDIVWTVKRRGAGVK